MSENFPKLKPWWKNIKIELDLSDYAIISDLKHATGIETSDFPEKTDLDNLKFDEEKIDIDKLQNVQSNLSNWKSKVE